MKSSIPERALAQIVDPRDNSHLGWIVADDQPIEVGFATRVDDVTLVQTFTKGKVPDGAQLVVVLPVVR